MSIETAQETCSSQSRVPDLRLGTHIKLAGITTLLLVVGILANSAHRYAAWAAQSKTEPAIAFAARVVGDANRARLIVDFDRPVEHDSYLKKDPARVVVDLPQTLFSLPSDANIVPNSVVKSIRYEGFGEGRSQIVMELSAPVKIESNRIKEVSGGTRHRLIVDLVKSTKEVFEKTARLDAPKVVAPKRKAREFTVVIDPGHGGIDGGATGKAGTTEKDVTLNFANHLKTALAANSRFNVILTRTDDRFLALRARVGVARANKADLFISVHADSLRQRNIRGATVYTLSEEGSDDLSRALAKKQNRSDLIAGLELPTEKPDVTDILIDLTRRESEAYSVRFADKLIKKFEKDIKLIRNPRRAADFFVLKAPDVPSVLLELGYLSNKEDEQLMMSEAWQTKAATRVKQAIETFFDARLASQ